MPISRCLPLTWSQCGQVVWGASAELDLATQIVFRTMFPNGLASLRDVEEVLRELVSRHDVLRLTMPEGLGLDALNGGQRIASTGEASIDYRFLQGKRLTAPQVLRAIDVENGAGNLHLDPSVRPTLALPYRDVHGGFGCAFVSSHFLIDGGGAEILARDANAIAAGERLPPAVQLEEVVTLESSDSMASLSRENIERMSYEVGRIPLGRLTLPPSRDGHFAWGNFPALARQLAAISRNFGVAESSALSAIVSAAEARIAGVQAIPLFSLFRRGYGTRLSAFAGLGVTTTFVPVEVTGGALRSDFVEVVAESAWRAQLTSAYNPLDWERAKARMAQSVGRSALNGALMINYHQAPTELLQAQIVGPPGEVTTGRSSGPQVHAKYVDALVSTDNVRLAVSARDIEGSAPSADQLIRAVLDVALAAYQVSLAV